MYTGRMIEELMESVERAEQHAHLMMADSLRPMQVEVRQVGDTFLYDFLPAQLAGVA